MFAHALADDERARVEPIALVEAQLEAGLADPSARRTVQEIAGALRGGPTEHEAPAAAWARVRAALRAGVLAALRVDRPLPAFAAARSGAPARPPATGELLEERTWFELVVVDERGEPVGDLELEFSYQDARTRRTTDASGRARLEDVDASFATAALADLDAARTLLRPRWQQPRGGPAALPAHVQIWQAIAPAPTLGLQCERPRTVSLRPSVRRLRLVAGYFDTSKSFLLPSGLPGLRAAIRLCGRRSDSSLLIVGHTDTAGAPEYNATLSLARAEAVAALLRADAEAWYRWYDPGVAADRRWGDIEDQHMLDALPDASERPPHEPRVRWFQRTRGLAVDGVAGTETRHALLREYMRLADASLPAELAVTTHGCGEHFPCEATGDGRADLRNRRIELFLFDDGLGVLPEPPGDRSSADSPQYPEWLARAGEPIDFVADEAALTLRLEWAEDVIARLPADAAIVLSGPRLAERVQPLDAAERDDGVVRVTFEALDRGQRVTLTARHGGGELVLVDDQPAGDLERGLAWEHAIEELMTPDEPEQDDGELVAVGGLPDDTHRRRGPTDWA